MKKNKFTFQKKAKSIILCGVELIFRSFGFKFPNSKLSDQTEEAKIRRFFLELFLLFL